MNLKKLGRTLWVIAAVAILAMVLQGCGGDSDNGIGQDQQAMLDLLGELQGVELPDGAALTAVSLTALVEQAKSLAALQGVTLPDGVALTVDNLMSLVSDLNTANMDMRAMRNALSSLPGNMELNATTIQYLVDEYNKGVKARIDAAHMEKVDRAKKVAEAINNNRTGDTRVRHDMDDADRTGDDASQLPFTTAVGADGHGITAERDADDMVTVELATSMGDVKWTGGEATAMDGYMWTGTMLTRTMDDDSEQTAMVYTDIEAPTPTTLGSELSTGSVTIDDADERGRIMPGGPQPTDSAEVTYDQNMEFEGTYRGIAGTFECTRSGGCTLSLNDDDEVVVDASDTFSFVPDSIAAMYDDPDMMYVYFGWWLSKPEKAGDDHMVESFSGGNNMFPATGLAETDLEGTARYMGKAAGKYVAKSFTAGALSDAEAGHFSADAMLMADFDANTAPEGQTANTDGMISGMVDNFMLSGETDGSAWEVMLGDANLSTSESLFNGMTSVDFGGGEVEDAGRWQGQFYNDMDSDSTADAPGTVAGTFDAHTPGAHVTGGFGASMMMDMEDGS